MSEIAKAIYLRKGLQSFSTWPPTTKTNLFFFETFSCMMYALYHEKEKHTTLLWDERKNKPINAWPEKLILPISDTVIIYQIVMRVIERQKVIFYNTFAVGFSNILL